MTGLDMDHFVARLLQDALAEATAKYWLKRADDFERARSRSGDFLGGSTSDDVAARDARLTGLANSCRARAALAPQPGGEIAPFIIDVIDEVA